MIVTNKHVIAGATRGTFHLHNYDPKDKSLPLDRSEASFDDFESHWIFHPDPKVDLCVMPIGPIMDAIRRAGRELFYRSLDQKWLPTEDQAKELRPIEDVTMMGYPIGLWDSLNNLPIVRRGITATPFYKDFKGYKEFMIDMAIFPGSSGSPVIILNEGHHSDKRGNLIMSDRLYLLGILYAAPQFSVKGELKVMPVPTATDVISKVNANLGYVIKSSRLEEMKEEVLRTTGTSIEK